MALLSAASCEYSEPAIYAAISFVLSTVQPSLVGRALPLRIAALKINAVQLLRPRHAKTLLPRRSRSRRPRGWGRAAPRRRLRGRLRGDGRRFVGPAGDLEQEPAGHGGAGFAPFLTGEGQSHREPVLCPRDPH